VQGVSVHFSSQKRPRLRRSKTVRAHLIASEGNAVSSTTVSAQRHLKDVSFIFLIFYWRNGI
jgi:hypothetical protein